MNNTYMESDQSYFSWFDSSSGAEGQLSSQFFWKSKEKPVPSKKTLDYLILPTAGPLNFQTFRRLWSCIIKMLVSQIRRKISERNSSHGRFHYLAKVAKSRRVFSYSPTCLNVNRKVDGHWFRSFMFRSSRFWFLVFGNIWRQSYENTKILRNLCLHFARQDG